MIVPDVNLLIYAHDASSKFHTAAARWWSQCLSGTHPVGLAHPVLFGFLRIATSARIFTQPMRLAEAGDHVHQWLQRNVTQVLLEDTEHAARVMALLQEAGSPGGNLVTDAQIAALALAHKAQVHTADRDFLRFPALDCCFPLSD